MSFGFRLPNGLSMATPENFRTLAVQGEELGYDHIWCGDHIVMPTQVSSPYPYSTTGVPPFDPTQPWCEPLSTLSYIAGCTQRIKLGTYVLILPYREPVFTAKLVSTLDYVSGGRAILGAGVGWMEEEFKALGLDTFPERGRVANDDLRIFNELWTKDDPEFQGRYTSFSGIKFYPKPVQKPRPPIWIGGHTPAAIRRAALLGDCWLPVGLRPNAELEPHEMADLIDQLRDISEEAGRSREDVEIAFGADPVFDPPPGEPKRMLSGSAEEIGADIVLYQQVGVEHFVFGFAGNGLEEMLENVQRFALDVMPNVR